MSSSNYDYCRAVVKLALPGAGQLAAGMSNDTKWYWVKNGVLTNEVCDPCADPVMDFQKELQQQACPLGGSGGTVTPPSQDTTPSGGIPQVPNVSTPATTTPATVTTQDATDFLSKAFAFLSSLPPIGIIGLALLIAIIIKGVKR